MYPKSAHKKAEKDSRPHTGHDTGAGERQRCTTEALRYRNLKNQPSHASALVLHRAGEHLQPQVWAYPLAAFHGFHRDPQGIVLTHAKVHVF